MCTVTIVPAPGGFSLGCNRDERRTRVTAMPPGWHPHDGISAIWPIDPRSGGTWVGANTAGLAAAILNESHGGQPTPGRRIRSRGIVVPRLLRERTIDDALDAAWSLPIAEFERFSVVLVQRDSLARLTVSADRIVISRDPLGAPAMFTSSSLTDAAIPVGRRHLFEQLVVDAADLVLAQETYHDHQWRDRPHMSVRMSRADAATVSQTFLSIDGDRIGVRFVRITDPS